MKRIPRGEYPICPHCGEQTIVAAMMTSGALRHHPAPKAPEDLGPGVMYYRPDAISVYCCNGACNYDHPLTDLKYPPTEHGEELDA